MRYLRILALATFTILASFPGRPALAATPSCKNPITACGCIIDKRAVLRVTNGIFTVANNLTATQSNSCIEISQPNTVLNLKGHFIVGAGSGIGILIDAGADHVVVAGADVGADAEASGVVANWDTGIEDDGDRAALGPFNNIGGIFEGAPGNNIGILLNGVSSSTVFNFHADTNNHVGVMLNKAQNCRLNNFDASGNDTGVMANSSNGNRFASASMMANRKVGIWFLSSSNNALFDCNGTESNHDVGILLGCGPEIGCQAVGSNNNRISSCGAENSSVAGILVDQGNGNNIITVTHNSGNPMYADMVDNNPSCGTDLWYNNEGMGNQKCVLLNPMKP